MCIERAQEVKALEDEIAVLRHLHHEVAAAAVCAVMSFAQRIVQYYGMEHSSTCLTIFMEYVPGVCVRRAACR